MLALAYEHNTIQVCQQMQTKSEYVTLYIRTLLIKHLIKSI